MIKVAALHGVGRPAMLRLPDNLDRIPAQQWIIAQHEKRFHCSNSLLIASGKGT